MLTVQIFATVQQSEMQQQVLLSITSKYTSASTLVAVGGTYTFAYNALTNQLSVKYSK